MAAWPFGLAAQSAADRIASLFFKILRGTVDHLGDLAHIERNGVVLDKHERAQDVCFLFIIGRDAVMLKAFAHFLAQRIGHGRLAFIAADDGAHDVHALMFGLIAIVFFQVCFDRFDLAVFQIDRFDLIAVTLHFIADESGLEALLEPLH